MKKLYQRNLCKLEILKILSHLARNILEMFPEGSLKVLTSLSYKRLSGDQYKYWQFNEKIVFLKQ